MTKEEQEMAIAVQEAVAQKKTTAEIMRLIKQWRNKIAGAEEGGAKCRK